MKTIIYMIRHGESPKTEGTERTRGLTEKGKLDAARITALLQKEQIDCFVSSPYLRAVVTIEELARMNGQEVLIFEDLKERVFFNEDSRMPDSELYPLLEQSFSDPDYALPGAESNGECQTRAVNVFKELLSAYRGRKVAVGTHGAVMTLIMGYYDKKYDYLFLLKTTKPDVYRMEFDDEVLVRVDRLWDGQ